MELFAEWSGNGLPVLLLRIELCQPGLSGRDFKVGDCNGVYLLPNSFGSGKWNGKRNLWSWVQDFLGKRFARSGAFRGMQGNGLKVYDVKSWSNSAINSFLSIKCMERSRFFRTFFRNELSLVMELDCF